MQRWRAGRRGAPCRPRWPRFFSSPPRPAEAATTPGHWTDSARPCSPIHNCNKAQQRHKVKHDISQERRYFVQPGVCVCLTGAGHSVIMFFKITFIKCCCTTTWHIHLFCLQDVFKMHICIEMKWSNSKSSVWGFSHSVLRRCLFDHGTTVTPAACQV